MLKVKKLIAILVLALVVGSGAPQAFADGPQETPGINATATTLSPGPQETPGVEGPQETPGIFDSLIDLLGSIWS